MMSNLKAGSDDEDPAKPKRPLTSFNLFYRYKRQKALERIALGSADTAAISAAILAPPGTEGALTPTDVTPDARRANVRRDMADKLLPKDHTKRRHRTNADAMGGSMSFVELSKVVNASWRSCDEHAKAIFQELAEEGRKSYYRAMDEYNVAEKARKKERKRRAKEAEKEEKKKKSKKDREALKKKKRPSDAEVSTAQAMIALTRGSGGSGGSSSPGGSSSSGDDARDVSPKRKSSKATKRKSQALPTVPEASGAAAQPNAAEESLRMRVQLLETQLAAELVRSQVQDLELVLARRRHAEEQSRLGLHLLYGGGGATGAATSALSGSAAASALSRAALDPLRASTLGAASVLPGAAGAGSSLAASILAGSAGDPLRSSSLAASVLADRSSALRGLGGLAGVPGTADLASLARARRITELEHSLSGGSAATAAAAASSMAAAAAARSNVAASSTLAAAAAAPKSDVAGNDASIVNVPRATSAPAGEYREEGDTARPIKKRRFTPP